MTPKYKSCHVVEAKLISCGTDSTVSDSKLAPWGQYEALQCFLAASGMPASWWFCQKLPIGSRLDQQQRGGGGGGGGQCIVDETPVTQNTRDHPITWCAYRLCVTLVLSCMQSHNAKLLPIQHATMDLHVELHLSSCSSCDTPYAETRAGNLVIVRNLVSLLGHVKHLIHCMTSSCDRKCPVVNPMGRENSVANISRTAPPQYASESYLQTDNQRMGPA